MDLNLTLSVDDVKATVVETLGIESRAQSLDASSPLLGALPELDSMAVLELVVALQERFEIEIDDEDITAEVFETLGSLATFVDGKRR
jgi:acyl carrier protein